MWKMVIIILLVSLSITESSSCVQSLRRRVREVCQSAADCCLRPRQEDLVRQIDQLREDLQIAREGDGKMITRLTEELRDSTALIKEMTESNKVWVDDSRIARKELREVTGQRDELGERLKEQEIALTKVETEKSELELNLNAAQGKIESLEAIIKINADESKRKEEASKKQNEALRNRNAHLEGKNGKLISDLQTVGQLQADTEQERSQLDSDLQKTRRGLYEMTQQREKEEAIFQGKERKLNDENKSLQEIMDKERDATNDAKQKFQNAKEKLENQTINGAALKKQLDDERLVVNELRTKHGLFSSNGNVRLVFSQEIGLIIIGCTGVLVVIFIFVAIACIGNHCKKNVEVFDSEDWLNKPRPSEAVPPSPIKECERFEIAIKMDDDEAMVQKKSSNNVFSEEEKCDEVKNLDHETPGFEVLPDSIYNDETVGRGL